MKNTISIIEPDLYSVFAITVFLLILLGIVICLGFMKERKEEGTFLKRQKNGAKNRTQWSEIESELFARQTEITIKSNEAQVSNFIDFLRSYKGSRILKNEDRIIEQEYSREEKELVQEMFYEVVLPNRNISIAAKENYRLFGVEVLHLEPLKKRPVYKLRDGKIKGARRKTDAVRKNVGNRAEQYVREQLDKLNPYEYYCISGVFVKIGNQVKEIDHIVAGKTGLFLIETKGYGVSGGKKKINRSKLFIDGVENDWYLFKYGKMRDIACPTAQILQQQELLRRIIDDDTIKIHPILYLPNKSLKVVQNVELPYTIVQAEALLSYIEGYEDRLSGGTTSRIIDKINLYREN